MIALKIVYAANVLVAGWISFTSLFNPQKAVTTVFENTVTYSESIRLIGCLWGAIFLLSIVGLFLPKQMSLVLVFQLIYKSSWLLFVVLPAIQKSAPYPKGMAGFFVVWVLILPFVIPWKEVFS